MSSTSARESFRFALQRELVKLYVAIFVGVSVLNGSSGAFHAIPNPYIRGLVRLPFTVVGWGMVLGGAVGVLHYVSLRTTGSPSDR